MTKKNYNRYYAVAFGRKIGIYESWPEAEKQVKGIKKSEADGFPEGAKHHGFSSMSAAEAYMVEHRGATWRMALQPQATSTQQQSGNHETNYHQPNRVSVADYADRAVVMPGGPMVVTSGAHSLASSTATRAGTSTRATYRDRSAFSGVAGGSRVRAREVEVIEISDDECDASPQRQRLRSEVQKWNVGAQRAAAIAQEVLDQRASKVEVFVDGACSNNGRGGAARAGYGAFYGRDNDPRNFSRPVPRTEQQTNNRGELYAILDVLKYENSAVEGCRTRLQPQVLFVRPDSTYCIKSITEWMPEWKRKNWKKANGAPVLNQDLMKEIDSLMARRKQLMLAAVGDVIESSYSKGRAASAEEQRAIRGVVEKGCVIFAHVKGHSGDYGNDKADELAVRGARM